VDTGLGRNGLTPADLPAVVDEALRLEAEGVVRLVGIWSHLAFADEPGHPSLHAQGDVLRAAAADAEARGARFEVRHIAASASTLTDPELHLDLVRPGIALYGLTPVPQLGGPERFGLVPAMTVEAELANVKRLPAGHGVSYGHHYVTPRDTVVGVVPLGYGDGVPRHASGQDGAPGAPLGVAGRRLAIAGRVCMDQVMVDLGPGATEQAGDRVVLFGNRDNLPWTGGRPRAGRCCSSPRDYREGTRSARCRPCGHPRRRGDQPTLAAYRCQGRPRGVGGATPATRGPRHGKSARQF
jgi:alanine racemase